jgi:hypothetical protein
MRCRVSRGSGPNYSIQQGSGVATHPMTQDPASLHERALGPPRDLQLWTPPPCSEGLQSRHTSYCYVARLPAQEGFDTAMCPTTCGR